MINKNKQKNSNLFAYYVGAKKKRNFSSGIDLFVTDPFWEIEVGVIEDGILFSERCRKQLSIPLRVEGRLEKSNRNRVSF